VIDFAVKKGYYNPESGKPFNFSKAYCPVTPQKLRYTAIRVWSIFRRCAPSKEWPVDYHRGIKGAKPYPLWIKPDKKLSLKDVIGIMRDHYEGTDYDMTKGVDAGPFGTPNRWRPITWNIDGVDYTWERPISTQQTGFSYVSQSRSWLPDPVGGILWYGVDDSYYTCYVPLYCGITDVPESYARGSMNEFSMDSAWWVFNFVANFSNLRYSPMREDIQAVQEELEGRLISLQTAVDMTAKELFKEDAGLMTSYLTDYSRTHAAMVVERWKELGKYLICKYNDGYTQTKEGRPMETGYPESWLRDVLKQRPEQFKLGNWGKDSVETEDLEPLGDRRVVAVDLGETQTISVMVDDGKTLLYSGREIKSIRRYWKKVRTHVKPSVKYQKRSRRYSEIDRKESRQVNHRIHQITKDFVDRCNNAGVSPKVIGDLTGNSRKYSIWNENEPASARMVICKSSGADSL
jgi:hypothetical protein